MTDPVTAPADRPTSPVVRSCRDVIGAAGQVTAAILSLPDDPRVVLESVKRTNPALAGPLTLLMDSVAELDHRTGFMDGQDWPSAVQPFG